MISDKQLLVQCAVYNGHVKEVGKRKSKEMHRTEEFVPYCHHISNC